MSPETAGLRARLIAISLAVAAIFWLPVEDTSPLSAQLLGLMGAFALGVRFFPAIRGRGWPAYLGWGLGCGMVVSPLAAALMLVKIGLHGHGGFPDFSPEEFFTVLLRTPVFAGGGLLTAAGIYLLTD